MQIRAILLGLLPPSPGGATFSVAQIVSGIARAGHEVCAVAPMTTEALRDGGDWFAARHLELRVVRYWVPEFYLQTYKPRPEEVVEQERRQIERLVSELAGSFRPNLFIAGREVSGFVTREMAGRLGLPWSMWLRGIPTAHILSGLFSEEEAEPFLDLYRSADQVIAVARYFCSGLEQRYGITNVRYVPNAIDLDAFSPRGPSAALRSELGVDEAAATVLLPGTLISRKRPLDLLKAAELVLERDRSVVFLLAGVGVLHDELMRFCRERGITDRVRFLGWVPHERMPELYRAADLVVMTSEAEGVSRACIEALACGRALLASDIPAARELIEDGRNGFLFPTGDHRALAKRILALLKDDRLRAEVSRRARESVLERRLDRSVAMYVEELQALLRRSA